MSIVSKVIGPKREWRAYKVRMRALPEPYSAAAQGIERSLLHFGPGRSDRIMTMLGDLADLFEQSAANRVPLRDVVGDDRSSSPRPSSGTPRRPAGSPKSAPSSPRRSTAPSRVATRDDGATVIDRRRGA